MAIRIIEIHPADDPKTLNTEWFVVENDGDGPFSTRNCTLGVTRGSKKRVDLGTLDPGFTLAPGARVRVVTGSPGKKVHGAAPVDDTTNYNLFLNAPVLRGPGTVLVFHLRSHVLCTAKFEPGADHGLGREE